LLLKIKKVKSIRFEVLAHFGLFMVRLLWPSGEEDKFFVGAVYSYGTGLQQKTMSDKASRQTAALPFPWNRPNRGVVDWARVALSGKES